MLWRRWGDVFSCCVGKGRNFIRDVLLWLERGCFIIRTESPVKRKNRGKKRRIPGLERGAGMRILKEFAEKYDGCLGCMVENGLFRAKLILKLGVDYE